MIQPIILKWLTEYFSPGSSVTTLDAYLLAMGMGLSTLVIAILDAPQLLLRLAAGHARSNRLVLAGIQTCKFSGVARIFPVGRGGPWVFVVGH